VDIGLAQLAMHSCYETAGAKDTEYLVRAMKEYFSRSIRKTPEGISL
jgi:aspartyl aminopeptidase